VCSVSPRIAAIVLARARQVPAPTSGAAADTQPVASREKPTVTSVAVLPLVNVGGDTAQEYFADGMTDEITGALGRVTGLRVASRTSAFAFKARRDADVRDIGRRLNVDAVLEGTMQRAGDRIRLRAQLTSTRDGLSLWSETYDRRLSDVFQVQDNLARAITGAL
jgi:serine/threonine-protein kinase